MDTAAAQPLRQHQQLPGLGGEQRAFTLVIKARRLEHHHAHLCRHSWPCLQVTRYFNHADLERAGGHRFSGQHMTVRKAATARQAAQHLRTQHARGTRHDETGLAGG